VAYSLLAAIGALTLPHTLTCSYLGMAPPLMPTIAKLATLRPPLRPYSPYVPRALTFYRPPVLALCPLHAPTVWPLPLFLWPL
jgi:hypothetical protein